MATIQIAKKDLIWSYIGNFFKLATNILLLPLILKFLSDEELGLWYVFATISQLVILIDFGFAPALSRNISYVWCGAKSLNKQNVDIEIYEDIDSTFFYTILFTCRYIYIIISILSLIILSIFGTIYILSLDSSLFTTISWGIYAIGVFFNTLYSYFTSFLRGVGAIAENNKAGVYSKAIQLILSTCMLVCGLGLLGLSISYLLSGLVLRIVSKYYFENYHNIKSLITDIKIENRFAESFKLFKIIWKNASKDGLVTISNFLTTQANTLICSSYLGLTITGSYGLIIQLSSVVSSLSGIPFSTYMPSLQEKALKGDNLGSLSIYATTMFLYTFLFIGLTICLILIMPILKEFKPSLDLNIWILLSIMLQMYIYQIYQHSASYISTFNIIPYAGAFIISSIITVLLSILLVRTTNLGIWSLIIAPVTISLAYNAWKWPLESLKITNSSIRTFVHVGYSGSIRYLNKIFKHNVEKK